MKFKKLLTGFCIMAVTLSAAMPVMAAENKVMDVEIKERPAMFFNKDFKISDVKITELSDAQKASLEAKFANLTDEQKAEKEAMRAEGEKAFKEAKAKWDALTDAQKETLYKLQEEKIDLEIKSVKTMSDLGLTDKTQAEEMIKMLTEHKAQIRNIEFLPPMMQPGVKVKVKIENNGDTAKADSFFVTTTSAAAE